MTSVKMPTPPTVQSVQYQIHTTEGSIETLLLLLDFVVQICLSQHYVNYERKLRSDENIKSSNKQ